MTHPLQNRQGKNSQLPGGGASSRSPFPWILCISMRHSMARPGREWVSCPTRKEHSPICVLLFWCPFKTEFPEVSAFEKPAQPTWMGTATRSSSREVRIRVPFFQVYCSRGTLPTKKGVRKGTTREPGKLLCVPMTSICLSPLKKIKRCPRVIDSH